MKHLLGEMVFLSFLVIMMVSCGSSPRAENPGVQGISVDTAIQQAARNIENNIEAGQKVIVLNFSSSSEEFSEYVLGELSTELVNGRKLQVVDRRNLEAIRAEMDFQMSGEVSDESAQAIGRKLGAEYIISGSLTNMGGIYRFRINTINVESAGIAASSATDIANDGKVQALLASGGGAGSGAYSGTQMVQRGNTGGNTTTPAAPAQLVAQESAEPPTPAYKIGDTGPAGGIIFYDKGNRSDGWRYLEAAPAETEKRVPFFVNYSASKDSYIGSILNTEEGLGTGKKNTNSILSYLASIGQWDMAAQVCDELEFNGYSDWYMPSFMELSLIYGNLYRKGLGNFKNEVYYSSSLGFGYWGAVRRDGLSRSFNFADGSSNSYYTEGAKPVRAIRQF